MFRNVEDSRNGIGPIQVRKTENMLKKIMKVWLSLRWPDLNLTRILNQVELGCFQVQKVNLNLTHYIFKMAWVDPFF